MIWGYPHDFGTPHIVKWVVVYWHPKHIFHDISWYFMIFHDISIYFMIFHDISWYFMIFHDISWLYNIVYHWSDLELQFQLPFDCTFAHFPRHASRQSRRAPGTGPNVRTWRRTGPPTESLDVLFAGGDGCYPLVNPLKKRWKITMLSMGKSTKKRWKITMLSMGKSTINHHFQ